MKKWILGLFLLAALGAAAQDLRVDYTEGRVELASGSGWKELAPGDRLPASAKVRLPEDGFLELTQGSTRFSVSQPGVYLVADLVAASKKVASWQLGKVVSAKVKGTVAGGAKGDGTAAMGARGAAAGAPATVEWVEASGSEEALSEGRSLLEAGRLDDALKVLQQALQEANPGEEGLFYYYIATAYSAQQRTSLALRTLERARIEPQEPVYSELVLLKGQLLLESLAFTDALALFDSQLALNPEGGFAQALLILSSYSHQGLGRSQKAREALQKAVSLDSSSELGREAARLLSQL
jgi:predicted negative regulator of RcsB-dependent stress response